MLSVCWQLISLFWFYWPTTKYSSVLLLQLTVVLSAKVNHSAPAACDECSGSSSWTCRCVTMWSQLWSSYIGCRLSKELHTSCVCSCDTSTLDKHHSTCQTVYLQFLHSVADIGSGRLTQRIAFWEERELDLENEVPPTVAQPPGTLVLPTSTTLVALVHSENDSRVYFLIVLTTDYCCCSSSCHIAAPYEFHIDWLIDWLFLSIFRDMIKFGGPGVAKKACV